MKQKLLFAIAAAILLLGFFLASKLYTGAQQEQGAQHSARNQANLVRMHSPTQGPAEARVLIVEFFDPACETCRSFHPFVQELMAAHPGQVRLAMRYTPFHNGSEGVVRILEAARRQGRYWETLEALYAAQDDWVQHHRVVADRVWPHLENLGLDLERLKQDLDAPEISAVIAQDMEDARALGVEKTPEFFVNGRPMPSFGREPLRRLVQDALAASGP